MVGRHHIPLGIQHQQRTHGRHGVHKRLQPLFSQLTAIGLGLPTRSSSRMPTSVRFTASSWRTSAS